jgi:hypothetical protein
MNKWQLYAMVVVLRAEELIGFAVFIGFSVC